MRREMACRMMPVTSFASMSPLRHDADTLPEWQAVSRPDCSAGCTLRSTGEWTLHSFDGSSGPAVAFDLIIQQQEIKLLHYWSNSG